MITRLWENYGKVLKMIPHREIDLRIFVSTLFNTGGTLLPGAREILFARLSVCLDLVNCEDLRGFGFRELKIVRFAGQS